MGFHPQLTHADQSLVFQPWVGHSGLRRQRLRQMPAVIGLNDLALLLVYHQFEFACEKARHARHHTCTGKRPLDNDVL